MSILLNNHALVCIIKHILTLILDLHPPFYFPPAPQALDNLIISPTNCKNPYLNCSSTPSLPASTSIAVCPAEFTALISTSHIFASVTTLSTP